MLTPGGDPAAVQAGPVRRKDTRRGSVDTSRHDGRGGAARGSHGFFDIEREDAERMASRMAAIVNGAWRKALRAEGASAGEIDAFAGAFQHDAMEQALALA